MGKKVATRIVAIPGRQKSRTTSRCRRDEKVADVERAQRRAESDWLTTTQDLGRVSNSEIVAPYADLRPTLEPRYRPARSENDALKKRVFSVELPTIRR